uniref:Phosphatidic acid phosphatase type 2D n=1 Tax=Hippocampus comes TaxID=109280 RepID=A0A3Q2YGG7_HIPCM
MENITGNKLTHSGQALFARKFLVVSDVLCLFLVSIPFFLSELKMVRPYTRGFICGDTSIAYPYLQSEVISDKLLIAGGILITGECYRVRFLGVTSKAFLRNKYVSCLYKELGSFLFGCCVGQSLTNVAKLSIGRLRPHFLSVCGVTYVSLNCTHGTYLESVRCNSTDHRSIEEHADSRLTCREARLVRPVLQFFLFLLAIYTGLTRITDNRHHPSDVLVGYILGALTAYWVVMINSLPCMFLECGGNRSTRRKPTQARGEHAKDVSMFPDYITD